MQSHRRFPAVLTLLTLALGTSAWGQRFFPDDPIKQDLDNLPIEKPQFVDLSPSYDLFENSIGAEGLSELIRAQNANTIGEVPNSSWFSNRVGRKDWTIDQWLQPDDDWSGPDLTRPLTVRFGGLVSFQEGLVVEDARGHRYYLFFDPAGLPTLCTAANHITSRFLFGAGYHVVPTTLARINPEQLEVAPDAMVRQLGGKTQPLDRGFVDDLLRRSHKNDDGSFRVSALKIGGGEYLGQFRFHGTREDDPNDIFLHENRRELRGLRVFASWLNHYLTRAVNTAAYYIQSPEGGFVGHFLIDFTGSLGSGVDLDERLGPKSQRAGNEYSLGDNKATFKTAATLGIWQRPWTRVKFPDLPEVGNIEADFFDPENWKPDYPNPAFDRMLPDDAFWAAQILSRFSDEVIRAVVESAQFSDARSVDYLVDVLVRRRDKILEYYLSQLNPLTGFVVNGDALEFRNLGKDLGLADRSSYEFEWFSFDNLLGDTQQIGRSSNSGLTRTPLPTETHDFWMVRIRTRAAGRENWEKRVAVYIRNGPSPRVVGIDRELGIPDLDEPFFPD